MRTLDARDEWKDNLLSKYKVPSILPRNPKKHVADHRFILLPFSVVLEAGALLVLGGLHYS